VGILFTCEFVLLGILFIYFAIEHDFPSWYFFIIIFGIGQYCRYYLIKKEKVVELRNSNNGNSHF
jgi:hypothetical protein